MEANNIDIATNEYRLLRPHESLEGIKGEAGPVGLTLRRTPSLSYTIEHLNVESDEAQVISPQSPSNDAELGGAMSNNSTYGEVETGGKLKASNISLITLQIGNYTKIFSYQNGLVAKIYYAKQAMMWEIMESGLKTKIEFKWSHISGIRASYNSSNKVDPDVLEIELSQPPLFFVEKEPTPKKHTQWEPSTDFNDGSALLCRRHRITCQNGQNGILKEHYMRLLARCSKNITSHSRGCKDLHCN